MIKISDIKVGDIVAAEYEGQMKRGVVTDINHEDKEVCVETDVQDFWYEPDHLYPIALNEEQLLNLGFMKADNENGSVKYMKGAFRVLVPRKGDFSNIEIWWREDHRYLTHSISVHELQNHYLQMTKVGLVPA